MPAEYEAMRDSIHKGGKSLKVAKKIAAISYWKKHGVAVNSVDKPPAEKPKGKKKKSMFKPLKARRQT